MAGSPPSPHPDDSNAHHSPPPSQPPQQAQPTSQPSSRRLPPPCWSHDETIALIDAYRDKWYSLRRGNLKAFHWQEVADAVAGRCPLASPAKTAVQCRHKMEKLRKRYRSEIQRARSMPVSRFTSSWVHFKRMDAMEKGPTLAKPVDDSASDEDNDDEDDAELEGYEFPDVGRYGRNGGSGGKAGFGLVGNGVGGSGSGGGYSGGGGGGFRIKIPNGVSIAKPGSGFRSKGHGKYDDLPTASPNLGPLAARDGYWKGSGGSRAGGGAGAGGSGSGKREREGDAVSEMVAAINMLADGFVKTEQKKMEMAREIEVMRMDMETKRLKMILESQERVMEAFTKATSDKKKPKRMAASPE
uniref:Myb/SANT-like DNA-binding domain-containing protein n=1 Tax=Kalanchoe fedtschenkoi TaxID=63787 RepID=A0A7N1A7L1_KALFE